ncbi:MAG: hypothetical protein AUH86_12245 [Acidobacteria bacterium 13_1_40CM_4_58_4]|nr:MAG: hypothetical protein AUH86_12245 [Acidobacteria bacterium 13_1_40CM_4_58_4]
MRPVARTTKHKKASYILCLGIISIFGGHIPRALGQQPQKSKTSSASESALARRELNLIGEKIAKAVLDKDIPTLLSYDREDLRPEDEASLKDTKSNLYCFLFDSSCIQDGKWRSVRDKLSQSRPPGIHVFLARSRYDGHLYGTLVFYDRAAITNKDLTSPDFLCKESPTRIASWKFKLEDDKWKPVTPMFNNETEGLCSY